MAAVCPRRVMQKNVLKERDLKSERERSTGGISALISERQVNGLKVDNMAAQSQKNSRNLKN